MSIDEVVSPGFRLRPSLSGGGALGYRRRRARVSPGFRLRPSLSGRAPDVEGCGARVSPGFRLRPSLSVRYGQQGCTAANLVSPEFRLRPSLSSRSGRCLRRGAWCHSPRVAKGGHGQGEYKALMRPAGRCAALLAQVQTGVLAVGILFVVATARRGHQIRIRSTASRVTAWRRRS